tara:strand:+ start:33553 stop:34725 length:1173 start_codon:yes stop_codon:yes gene_type:complete
MSSGHSTTPVRLISQNGRFYELACTSVSIDIDRKVMAIPVPASGSTRVTADLNLTNSVITLEGVITDGDAVLSSTGQAASAIIDFSSIAASTNLNHSTQFVSSIVPFSASQGTYNNLDASVLNNDAFADYNRIQFWRGTVTAGEKNIFTVFFGVNNAAAGYDTTSSSDEYILSYHNGTSAKTAAEMATGLHNLITNEIPTLNSQIISGRNGANMAVEITFTNVPTGSSYTNDMYYPHATMVGSEPRMTTMNKGIEATSTANLSAGDIVQQLYAILSNSQNRWKDSNHSNSHYIIGLQLPYLSSIDVPTGEKHLSRVMYSTAGFGTGTFANKNTDFAKFGRTAGTDFDVTDGGVTFTGMKVAVDKATFVQVGGEPNVYSFTILLVATNMIL